jgi:hypothetical protein
VVADVGFTVARKWLWVPDLLVCWLGSLMGFWWRCFVYLRGRHKIVILYTASISMEAFVFQGVRSRNFAASYFCVT